MIIAIERMKLSQIYMR